MRIEADPHADRSHPTRSSRTIYLAKVMGLRMRRAAVDLTSGGSRLTRASDTSALEVAARNRSALISDHRPAERDFQVGKIENLRIACASLNGVMIPAGAVFSFWRQVGPPSTSRGYVTGRMLQEGCLVASTGGGLCQLSNALYDVALTAGCQILERHAHSSAIAGSAATRGRDATVAWNYVDLRFRPGQDLRLSCRLEGADLVVELHGEPGAFRPYVQIASGADSDPRHAREATSRTCATCNNVGCHLHEHG